MSESDVAAAVNEDYRVLNVVNAAREYERAHAGVTTAKKEEEIARKALEAKTVLTVAAKKELDALKKRINECAKQLVAGT